MTIRMPLRCGLLQMLVLAVLCRAGGLYGEQYFNEAPLPGAEEFGFAVEAGRRVPSLGQVNVLVVFAQFADDQADDTLPNYAADLFAADTPGSFTHFYHTLSLDQLQIHAIVLPRRYTSEQPGTAYPLTTTSDQLEEPVTGFGQFALEILRQVDADYDLAPFDNDGPDGRPDSGDDDGFVDFVFLILRTRPHNFLYGRADGIALLGFKEPYASNDPAADGETIGIRGTSHTGTMLLGGNFARTVGTMAHEFGHALGSRPLPDLYDASHLGKPDQAAAEYSAGIGKWGLMGLGTLGWQQAGKADGPNPFCAWSLEPGAWSSWAGSAPTTDD
jgi:M6 family metalloprotease-like protein